jgi:electron transport complex protein RnfC
MKHVVRLPAGGLFVQTRKEDIMDLPIRNAAVPPVAVVPMVQHEGEPSDCLVKVGDAVSEGMLIGKAKGPSGINIHSPIPGTVREIRTIPLHRGIESLAVVIDLGGEFDRLGKKVHMYPWKNLTRKELISLIADQGIVGMGGLGIPTRKKIASMEGKALEALIINGIESEPYLCSDYRVMVEKSPEVIEGINILQKILEPKRTILSVGRNRVKAWESLSTALQEVPEKAESVELVLMEEKFPVGDETQLAKALLKKKVTIGNPLIDFGVLVLNVSTVFAVYEGVVLRKPVMERVVTLAGKALAQPANLKVRIGTPILGLVEECGGFQVEPEKIICGGPFRGKGIFDLRTPLTKDITGVLFLTQEEIRAARRTACLNCGRCITVCPVGLNPSRLFKWIDHGNFKEAIQEGLGDCIECGCCAFVCPARIPLVQGLETGKHFAAHRKGTNE